MPPNSRKGEVMTAIKDYRTGEVLFSDNSLSLEDLVRKAIKEKKSLSGADLSRANLSMANLSRADLSGAYLSGAAGIDPRRTNPLLILLEQPGPIRAYKLLDKKGRSPFWSGSKLSFPIGASLEVPDANTDPNVEFGAGINVCTLDWAIRNWEPGRLIRVVEFTAADIACIPTATDGKFRLHRCTVVGEKDLVELGLVQPDKEEEAK